MKKTVRINQLVCHICQDNGKWLWLPVTDSAFYKTLVSNSRQPFDHYQRLLQKYLAPIRPVHEISYEEFIVIYNSIKNDGFKFSSPEVEINDLNQVRDGQHRLSVLYYLNGPELTLTFSNNKLVAINGKDKVHSQKNKGSDSGTQ